MKINKLIMLCAIVFSIAFTNNVSNNRETDYSINQLGGYLVYKGITSESNVATGMGGIIAGGGGGCAVKAGAAYVLGSNPIGWGIAAGALIL